MAEDPPPAGQPPFDRLPGWPAPPPGGAGGPGADRPPSAPPPGWNAPRPAWAEPTPGVSTTPPAPTTAPPLNGRLAVLRTRRGLAVVVVVVLLLVAAVAVAVVTSGGDGSSGGSATGGDRGAKVPAGKAGTDLPLLDGRLVVVTRPGWEKLESSPETATLQLPLGEATGRDLVATFIVVALPAGSSLDRLVTADGGTAFEVTAGGVALRAAAAATGVSGRVVAGAVRANATFYFSLSVSAFDGGPFDAALLRKLFTEQVAPQLRFP